MKNIRKWNGRDEASRIELPNDVLISGFRRARFIFHIYLGGNINDYDQLQVTPRGAEQIIEKKKKIV